MMWSLVVRQPGRSGRFVTGMAVERMRFDRERRAIVGQLEERSDRVHAYLMALERGDERRAEAQPADAP